MNEKGVCRTAPATPVLWKGKSLPSTTTLKSFEVLTVSDPKILNILLNVEVSSYLILYSSHMHQLQN